MGKPNDVYEKEADAMADKVVQRKPIFESKAEPPGENSLMRKCAHCEQEEKLQKKGDGGGDQAVSPGVESGLNSSRGSGAPLPGKTRDHMESSFGADFSKVRIHDNSSAVAMNRELNAQAFTHGNDIYFNSGKYDPGSQGGQHLLAHELTHVVQQSGDDSGVNRSPAPNVMRSGFSSTISICQNFLRSRKFHIAQGGGVRIEIHSEIPDKNVPGCDSFPFIVSLQKSNWLFDDKVSTCNGQSGATHTFLVGNLSEGDYYLNIERSFDNSYCCLTGDITVSEVSGQEIKSKDSRCEGSDDSVPNLGPDQKLEKAIRYALQSDKLEEKTKERLKELLEPASIATMVGFTVLFLFLQTNPLGWGADTLLLIGGVALLVGLGLTMNEVSAIIDHLSAFFSLSMRAKTEAELQAAGDHLADAITKIGVDIVLAILLHKAGKAAKSVVKPNPKLITEAKRISMPDGTKEPATPDSVVKDESLAQQAEGKEPALEPTVEVMKQYADIADYRKTEGLPAFDPANGETGTVAKVVSDGKASYGENTSLRSKGFELRKRGFELIKHRYPKAKSWSQVNFLTHAEAHALLEAWQSGNLGKNVSMFVDRLTCNMCEGGLPKLLTALGVEKITIFSDGSTTPVVVTAE